MLCLFISLRPKRRWNYARCILRYVAIIHAIFFPSTKRFKRRLFCCRPTSWLFTEFTHFLVIALDKNPTRMCRGWLFLIVYVYFSFTTELIDYEEINCRASTVIRDSLLYLALWLVHKNLHSTNQSSAHMKPVMTSSVAFSRAVFVFFSLSS